MKFLKNIWAWFDARTGLGGVIRPMALHLVPKNSRWWYVFGSATLVAFIVQIVSGIALATAYVPSAGNAFSSLQFITGQATFGRLLRGIHYFGASAMILLVGIHMARVFIMGSYKFPREVNWISGVALLGLTVTMGFTGQLLRWDQNAVWSAVVGAGQAARVPFIGKALTRIFLSSQNVDSNTVSHFFVLHVFILPALLIGVVGLHLYLVMRNGISEPPVAGRPVDLKTYTSGYHNMLDTNGQPFWPYSAWRDIVFGAFVVICIVTLAWVFGPASLDNPPDPSLTTANPKPDWYLLWYFAVLAMVPHELEDYVIILVPLLIGMGLFCVPFFSNKGERHWRRRPWAPVIVLFIVTCIVVLWRAGTQEAWTPHFDVKPLQAKTVGTHSLSAIQGSRVFYDKGCLFCHTIDNQGGLRGPDLTRVGDRLTRDQMVIRILNGSYNMPAYANNLTPQQLENVADFLQTRKKEP